MTSSATAALFAPAHPHVPLICRTITRILPSRIPPKRALFTAGEAGISADAQVMLIQCRDALASGRDGPPARVPGEVSGGAPAEVTDAGPGWFLPDTAARPSTGFHRAEASQSVCCAAGCCCCHAARCLAPGEAAGHQRGGKGTAATPCSRTMLSTRVTGSTPDQVITSVRERVTRRPRRSAARADWAQRTRREGPPGRR